jgi:hypothetical protein
VSRRRCWIIHSVSEQRTVLDVFVASPGDTAAERSRLDAVVAEINSRGRSKRSAVQLELIKWETHARPAAGRPQEVIFDTTTRTPDVLVGIFRQRLGTPTGIADSGTVEEIENALAFWQQFQEGRGRRIEVLLYFKKPPYDVSTEDEHEQLGRVLRFRKRISPELLVWDYDDPDDFESSVRRHLSRVVDEWVSQGGTSGAAAPDQQGAGYDASQLDRLLDAIARDTNKPGLIQDALEYIRVATGTSSGQLSYDDLSQYCERLLRFAESTQRVDILVLRAEIERLAGSWHSGYRCLLKASDLARAEGSAEAEARVVRHLARITWEHGLVSEDLVSRSERLLRDLPAELLESRALVSSVLADRLAYVRGTQDQRQALAQQAIAYIDDVLDPSVAADVLLPVRQALYDLEPITTLYEYAVRVEQIGRELGDTRLISEGLGAQMVDLLRQRNVTGLRATLRRHRQLCGMTEAQPPAFRQITVEALLALAEGRFADAQDRTSRAVGILGGIITSEDNAASQDVIAAQEVYRLYETKDPKLHQLATELTQRLGEGVPGAENGWRLAIALVSFATDDTEGGLLLLNEVAQSTNGFAALERGLFRITDLALGAEVVWSASLARGEDPSFVGIGETLAGELEQHGDQGVLIGFPAVFLGDKRRYQALALAAAGEMKASADLLQQALDWSRTSGLAALEAHCLFDLAQLAALSPRTVKHADQIEMKARARATELNMPTLAERPIVRRSSRKTRDASQR